MRRFVPSVDSFKCAVGPRHRFGTAALFFSSNQATNASCLSRLVNADVIPEAFATISREEISNRLFQDAVLVASLRLGFDLILSVLSFCVQRGIS